MDKKLVWNDSFIVDDGHGRINILDSAPYLPKAVVQEPDILKDSGTVHEINRGWNETIIYEAHLKGFTILNEAIAPEKRGRFAGMADPEIVKYFKKIGVTAIELLPVQAFSSDKHIAEHGLSNYWGYEPIAYHAVHPDYGTPAEFKKMVNELHKNGIEVIMDVVYNHTGEGDQQVQTYSLKGLDNTSYYRFQDDKSRYIDTTGCGNSLDLTKTMSRKLALDSLRYFAGEIGVDGFRFDLATTLFRDRNNNYDKNHVFFEDIRNDAVLSKVKLIAEPWDCGMGGYQVGNFPKGWAQWNDRFRDDTKLFWLGSSGIAASMARRMMASDDLRNEGSNMSPSVNFITSHDGFTLRDWVSYSRKYNQANSWNDRDGADHNYSNNHGFEGETNDPEINRKRGRKMRNMLATLILARGTPMVTAGDEFARTQGGNNNPYNQDNPISWIDWKKIDRQANEQKEFFAFLTWIRKENPVFSSIEYLDDYGRRDSNDENKKVIWRRPDGERMQDYDWSAPYARTLSYQLIGGNGKNEFFVIMNACDDAIEWKLPELADGKKWEIVFDTADMGSEKKSEEVRKVVNGKRIISGSSFVLFKV